MSKNGLLLVLEADPSTNGMASASKMVSSRGPVSVSM